LKFVDMSCMSLSGTSHVTKKKTATTNINNHQNTPIIFNSKKMDVTFSQQ